jgi:uncharacterized protein YjbJ (UPF0337 family)
VDGNVPGIELAVSWEMSNTLFPKACRSRRFRYEPIDPIRTNERELNHITREDRTMGDHKSGADEAIKGVVEDIKGKAKEVGGTLAGRDDVVEEGKAQQDKAEAQRDVAKKEAEAEAARAGERAAEARQKANQ